MINSRKALLIFLLLGITLVPRLLSLRSFVTIDEPFWLSVGANYYYALGQRELENTVYEYHPAVTTMSFVTAAFLVEFPDYRGLGQGYFDVDKEKFDPFLIEYGHDPMYLLYLSRLFQVAMIVLFALIIFYLLSVLVGDEKAFLITAFISSAPYFLGHSRVLSHEAMVAFFVLASLFGMMAYLQYERKWYYLLISAVSAALAQLTKSSAMAMFPVIALMLAVSILEKRRDADLKSVLTDHLRIAGLWFLQLCVVYFIFWPGMWVAPVKMLYEVYGNAFSYALQGARLQVTEELQPATFSVSTISRIINTMNGFVHVAILKATPLSWLGLLLAVGFLFSKERNSYTKTFKQLTLYLFVTALMFALLFSVAQGRNSSHYIMSSYVSIDAIAALGWCSFLIWLGTRLKTAHGFQNWAIAVLIVIQLFSALSYYPYYYTYNNPLLKMISGRESFSDYGEGFEQAALYLSQKPNAASLRVLSFRGRGAFSYFFPGQTVILNPLFVEDTGMPSLQERFEGSDYLVINEAFAARTRRSSLFMDALKGTMPERVIKIKGVSTIYIYKIADLPPSFYEVFSVE
jgi:4-amino-4-deoxy-L-arabinose transferase-like glycosyltransferase